MGIYAPHQQPVLAVQELLAGVAFADLPPAGGAMVDSKDTILRGLYRKWTGCAAAGRFDVDPQHGNRICAVVFSVPGTTLTLNIVENAVGGFIYPVFVSAGASGFFDTDTDVLVPPDCHIACVTAGVLGAPGRVMIEFGQGLRPSAFEYFGNLGSEARPPGP